MKWPWNNANENDADLKDVQALQGGDDEALRRIMGRYKEQIYRFLLHSMHYNRFQAEDLTQEVFVRCYNSIDQFSGRGSLKHWLFRIANNLLKDMARSRRYKESMRTDSLDSQPDDDDQVKPLEVLTLEANPASAMQNRETLDALKQAIADLPEDLKAPFVLAVLEQMSHIEVGAQLGLSSKAVEMRVYKARKLLEEKMKGHLEG
jgi:RNA polymerase sigma factor (sigma-70 family)